MFVFSFRNGNNDHTRDAFDKYYMTLVETKDFNALIDSKSFFETNKKHMNNLLKCQETMIIQEEMY